jgi:hypothetical protein
LDKSKQVNAGGNAALGAASWVVGGAVVVDADAVPVTGGTVVLAVDIKPSDRAAGRSR